MDNELMECGHPKRYYEPNSLNNCIMCDRNDWERISATESRAAINARSELKDLRDTLAELEKLMPCGHEARFLLWTDVSPSKCTMCWVDELEAELEVWDTPYEAAVKAATSLFSDVSVPKEETHTNLVNLVEKIYGMIEMVEDGWK